MPPKWLVDLNSKQRAVILGKAHAILLDYPFDERSLLAQDLQRAAGTVWALKCACEKAIETESKVPMIQIDAYNETALNTELGTRCEIVYKHGKAYANIAGLIALEEGKHTAKHIRTTLTNWQRHNVDEYKALRPYDFNGIWLYDVGAWDVVRLRIKIQRKVDK